MTGVTVGGIGYHVALELARAGARVVLAGRHPDRLVAGGGGDPRGGAEHLAPAPGRRPGLAGLGA